MYVQYDVPLTQGTNLSYTVQVHDITNPQHKHQIYSTKASYMYKT